MIHSKANGDWGGLQSLRVDRISMRCSDNVELRLDFRLRPKGSAIWKSIDKVSDCMV